MRISEILKSTSESANENRPHRKLDLHLALSSKDLTNLASALTKGGLVKHFRNLNRKRIFLSKSRYMSGRQCPKRLWQTVYDPEPGEEPLPRHRQRHGYRGRHQGAAASDPRCRPERLQRSLCDLPSARTAAPRCRSYHYGCGRAVRTTRDLERLTVNQDPSCRL